MMTHLPEDQKTALFLILNSPVNPETGCWEWQRSKCTSGYGQAKRQGKLHQTHRLSYETFTGPIPDGLQIDHVSARGCRARHCCNPAHLEAVTQAENIRRGEAPGMVTKRTGVCRRGHEMTGDNVMRSSRQTACRECHRAAADRRKAAAKGGAA
ncbi:HNH endonuclease signature motif containing protein [Nocardia asiatica]|uniref:HNH endonuclease signature motif containing protein n=1 Tax=Nocardia asiatica TaxID=209252 RepID=UPI002455215F|nr:HNH endonuclease signature motif containing protein [Nocardia asiatica]